MRRHSIRLPLHILTLFILLSMLLARTRTGAERLKEFDTYAARAESDC